MRTLVILLLSALAAMAAGREVAITVDDLPRGGDGGPTNLAAVRTMTRRLLKPFRDQKIPVTGFVNEGRISELGGPGLREILDLWLDAGADLGNHSYSHLNINQVPLEQYLNDIIRGEPILRAALRAREKGATFLPSSVSIHRPHSGHQTEAATISR